ncbi:MAG: stage II sporulation protein R [Clostridia bacterium]|nr:stage II sporulation protein R [Clostridia bacterium]
MKAIAVTVASILVFLTVNAVIPTKSEAEIYDSTVRLHVLANSNEEKDQALKLKVRDALLEEIKNYSPESKQEALSLIEENKGELVKIAEDVSKKEGFDYQVTIDVGTESYPTRHYAGFALPAGEYTSVRVLIGSGEGENWWCVLYPPLCTSTAIEYDDDYYIDVGLTKEQYNLITQSNGQYKVKFKLLEMASQVFGFKYD